jgi:hypothetical protein
MHIIVLLCSDPREPWHDIHMRLTNKGALDIYNNFKDRVMKEQEEKTNFADEVKFYDVEGLPKLAGDCPATGKWRTQVWMLCVCPYRTGYSSDMLVPLLVLLQLLCNGVILPSCGSLDHISMPCWFSCRLFARLTNRQPFSRAARPRS